MNSNKQDKQEASKSILGLDAKQLNNLINETLKEVSKTITPYKWTNTAIIISGIILILGAAICSVIWHTNAQVSLMHNIFLAFGGFGLAVIIASLIANPINSVNKTARQLQIQIAYFIFLKQIEIFNEVWKDENTLNVAIKQKEHLDGITKSLQETLFKYFDEHDD
jgi:phosphotransferase system  glucose/maltose/N-acetylglucosamine-specific IIC component